MLVWTLVWITSILGKFLICYSFYFIAIVCARIVFKIIQKSTQRIKSDRKLAVLVTGGTSGIGLAVVKHLHRKGFSVIVGCYGTDEPGYHELEEMSSQYIHLVDIDVTSDESIEESYKTSAEILVKNRLKLHALVNNAGLGQTIRSQWLSKRSIRRLVNTNLVGPMLMSKQYLPLLAKSPYSRIINVSSVLSFFNSPFVGVYGATKSGLAAYTNSLSYDINKHNIQTVTVFPGNLIKNTSILVRQPNIEPDMQSLTAEEKVLYLDEFKKHKTMLDKTITRAQAYQEKMTTTRKGSKNKNFFRNILMTASMFSGTIKSGQNLEDSEAMDSFDDAVTLKCPPSQVFAGCRMYSIVSGSFLESLSQGSLALFSKLSDHVLFKLV